MTTVWKPAFEELEYFDPRLAIDLETLMDRYTESPAPAADGRGPERARGRLAGRARRSGSASGQGDGFNFFARRQFRLVVGRAPRSNASTSTRWGNPKKKWTRAVRAIVLLEHIGTPGCRGDPRRTWPPAIPTPSPPRWPGKPWTRHGPSSRVTTKPGLEPPKSPRIFPLTRILNLYYTMSRHPTIRSREGSRRLIEARILPEKETSDVEAW